MKYQLLTGLLAALVLPALSPVPTQAQTDPVFDTAFATPESLSDPATAPSTQHSLPPEATEAIATPPDSLSAATRNDLTPDLVQVVAHRLNDTDAATLFLRNIPLLTFLGADLSAEATGADTADKVDTVSDVTATDVTAADPAVQANVFAARIDQMHQSGVDANSISARWNGDEEQFEVMVGEEVFVALTDRVVLPDSTDNLAEDTLQVTNRLRRLLGDVAPIADIEGRPAPPAPPAQTVAVRSVSSGLASWYGPGFHGRRSASGEVFNQNAMTAAHRTLPFGTRVRVTNVNNGRQVIVRINDRGPFSGGRVIDLSAAAAGAIGLRSAGVGTVQIEVLGN